MENNSALSESTDLTFGDLPDGHHAMAVMGAAGDTKYHWDASKPAEVEAARRQFEFFMNDKKYAAFRMSRDGAQGEQIREFDPNAGRIIFAPPMQGG